MDPFSALSIAAAVVQFVDYTTGLLKDYRDIRQVGQPLTYEAFEQTTNDLLKLNATLKSRSRRAHGPLGPSAEDEMALDRMLGECSEIARNLADALRSLRPKKIDRAEAEELGRKGKTVERCKWTNFLQALRTIWKADHIEDLRARLSIYREQLVLRVLSCLNSKIDVYLGRQSDELENVRRRDTKIVEVLAFNQGEAKELRRRVDDSLDLIKRNHGEVIAAILTLTTGETRTIHPQSSSTTLNSRDFEQGVLQISSHQSDNKLQACLGSLRFDELQHQILDNIYFRHIKTRMDDIQEAHYATFRWIFQKPSQLAKPWSNFPQWLENCGDFYWINGKAGSGKSTLMKYVWQDPTTWAHLEKWAKGDSLVCASFFFWNLGTPLQKRQEGLLRSLLHDILERQPKLIPAVFQELCKEAANSLSPVIGEPTLPDLKRWFRRLAGQASPSHRFFFLIDGIDEYEGDYLELLELLASAASSNVKFVVSSRPIPSCTDFFASAPGLRLHDLTWDDMHQYCESMIGKTLVKRGGLEWFGLLDELVAKSQGIFLWIALVVKSVRVGLQDGDKISELRARLEELPSDLADLYAHMLRRIPINYREQASNIFQVYARSRAVEQGIRNQPLLAIQLSFAEEDWTTVREAKFEKMTRKAEQRRLDEIDRRIRSRCCGLLELQKRKYRRRPKAMIEHLIGDTTIVRPHIEFLHRTVAEFLDEQGVWAEIKSWSQHNPYHALFFSCIMMAKSHSPMQVAQRQGNLVWQCMYSGLRYAQLSEKQQDPIPTACLREFDMTLSKHWCLADSYAQMGYHKATSDTHWSAILLLDNYGSDAATWVDETQNCDNSFRWLVATDRHPELLQQTKSLGFLCVSIIYSFKTYLADELATSTHDALRDFLKFWLGLLNSTFTLRLRMPALPGLGQALLEAVTGTTSNLDKHAALVSWDIFLIELCSTRHIEAVDARQIETLEQQVMEFLRPLENLAQDPNTNAQEVRSVEFLQLLSPRLMPLKMSNTDLHESLSRVLQWLKAHSMPPNPPSMPMLQAKLTSQDVTQATNASKTACSQLPDNSSRPQLSRIVQIVKFEKKRLSLSFNKRRAAWAGRQERWEEIQRGDAEEE